MECSLTKDERNRLKEEMADIFNSPSEGVPFQVVNNY